MSLTGDLGSIDLANVFQMLLLSQKTGTLSIRSRDGRSEVLFDGDAVLVPFDRDAYPTRVVRALERAGVLTAEQVARAQASLGIVQRDLFTILLQMRAVTAEQISAAWRQQMEEDIFELFVDRDATFEFREGEQPTLPGKVIDPRYRLSGNGLLMEAARRLDEWAFIRDRVASDRCVFEVSNGAQSLPESERDDDMLAVLRELDGARPVTVVVARSGLTRFVVSKKLALLVEMRAVYEVARETLLERARLFLRDQRAAEGLALLERALELGTGDAAAHEMAALAHQSLGRIGEACRHLAQVADGLERAGQRRPAAEVHLRIRDLLPTDVRCRERLVHHWLDDPEFFKGTQYAPENEALELASILRELGRTEPMKALLLELSKPLEKDARSSSRLADVAIECGEAKLAVQLLMSAGDSLAKAGQMAAAARLWRRVRTIDPNQEGLADRLARSARSVARAAMPTGGLLRAAAAAAVLAGAGAGVLAYNRNALAAFAELPVEERAVAGDFDGALAELASFRDDYPASIASFFLLGSRGDVLRERRRLAAEFAEERERSIAAEESRRQKLAEKAFAEALDALRLGDREAAAAGFERAAGLAGDARFIAEKDPATKARELRAILAAEQADAAAYVQAREQADWPRMRALGLKLLQRREARAADAPPILLPVRFMVEPAHARIEFDPPAAGDAVVADGAVVLLPAEHETRVRATCDGRHPVERALQPEQSGFEIELRLDRRPDLEIELPRPVLFPPLATGQSLYVVCADGRVAALDAATLAVRWEKPLPDLDDAAGPPELDGNGLRIGTSKGAQVWFEPATGELIGRQPGAAAPPAVELRREVATADGARLVAADHRIELRLAGGRVAAAWRSPVPIEWAVADAGGGWFGGGAWILRILPDRAAAGKSGGADGR